MSEDATRQFDMSFMNTGDINDTFSIFTQLAIGVTAALAYAPKDAMIVDSIHHAALSLLSRYNYPMEQDDQRAALRSIVDGLIDNAEQTLQECHKGTRGIVELIRELIAGLEQRKKEFDEAEQHMAECVEEHQRFHEEQVAAIPDVAIHVITRDDYSPN